METLQKKIDKLEAENAALKKDAEKWRKFCSKQTKHLNDVSAEERSERARKAVMARWNKR